MAGLFCADPRVARSTETARHLVAVGSVSEQVPPHQAERPDEPAVLGGSGVHGGSAVPVPSRVLERAAQIGLEI